ncbi:MAG: hypothetical protein JW889_14960 [Verrucomicrobia bacterium]|nr:hypothetical protein [Verrucomicrobiota bacterium]
MYRAGERQGPVQHVLVLKTRCSYPSGLPVWGTQFKVLEEEYSREGRLELRTRFHGEEKETGYQTNTYAYDSLGRLLEDVYNTDAFYRAYIMRNVYDERSRLAETIFLNNQNEPSSRRLYDYDSHGRRTAERTFEADGSESRAIRTSYPDDSAEKPNETASYDRDGRLELRTALVYTPEGKLLSSRTESALGFFQNGTTNTYDADGRLVHTVEKTRQQTKATSFDKHGNPTHEVVFDEKGRFLVRSCWLYAYDKYGNWTHCLDLRTTHVICGFHLIRPYEFSVKKIKYNNEAPATEQAQDGR